MKINVIGTSGSGKTTFGRQLAEILRIPFLEMDALFWGPNWSAPEDEVLFKKVAAALEGDSWVLDGNYTRTIPIKWDQVNIVIWLDFSFIRTLMQAINRAVKRVISQEELWPGTGNRETVRKLFSRQSIVLWTIQTHHRNKIRNARWMGEEKFAHIHFIRLKSPQEAAQFLEQIKLDPTAIRAF
jgi:adenylate kinase family enzyme